MLSVDSVELSYGSRKILSGCYLNCKVGEVVGLLGRNGCGKSSLLQIIFGSLKAKFKHLTIDGCIVKSGYKSSLVAYLPQKSFFPDFLTVTSILKTVESHDQEFVTKFDKILTQKYSILSGGERRLLECYWILSQPSPYILLDEPFTALSPIQTSDLQRFIKTKRKTKGIILTDHHYFSLKTISDRIVLLHNNSNYQIAGEHDLILYGYLPSE